MRSEANEMQRVPPRSLRLGIHTVMHRKEEHEEERNSKVVFTSSLCMQSSSMGHLPKCKGVFPRPSLWFGSAPWSRSSCTGNKETEPHQSLPFAPQVRSTQAAGTQSSHQAALQVLLLSSSASSQRQGTVVVKQCRRTQYKVRQYHCPWDSQGEELRLMTSFLLHQYNPKAGSSGSPFSKGTWQALKSEFS